MKTITMLGSAYSPLRFQILDGVVGAEAVEEAVLIFVTLSLKVALH